MIIDKWKHIMVVSSESRSACLRKLPIRDKFLYSFAQLSEYKSNVFLFLWFCKRSEMITHQEWASKYDEEKFDSKTSKIADSICSIATSIFETSIFIKSPQKSLPSSCLDTSDSCLRNTEKLRIPASSAFFPSVIHKRELLSSKNLIPWSARFCMFLISCYRECSQER